MQTHNTNTHTEHAMSTLLRGRGLRFAKLVALVKKI